MSLGHEIKVATEQGEEYHGFIAELNLDKNFVSISGLYWPKDKPRPDQPIKISFDDIESGTVKGMFTAHGVEVKDLFDYIDNKRNR